MVGFHKLLYTSLVWLAHPYSPISPSPAPHSLTPLTPSVSFIVLQVTCVLQSFLIIFFYFDCKIIGFHTAFHNPSLWLNLLPLLISPFGIFPPSGSLLYFHFICSLLDPFPARRVIGPLPMVSSYHIYSS